jgi:hypothetical protein
MGDVTDERTKAMSFCGSCGSREVEEPVEITTTVCRGCGHLVVRDVGEATELGLLGRMTDGQLDTEERSWAQCAYHADHSTGVALARRHLRLLRIERIRRLARLTVGAS